MKYTLYILIALTLLLSACTGEKGAVGPKGIPGADGTNGTNGVPGSKGATGDPGAIGDPGIVGQTGSKGQTPALKVSYTDWNAQTGVEKVEAAYPRYRVSGNLGIASLFPEKYNSLEFSEKGYLLVKDGTTGLPAGMLYHYVRLVENSTEIIFREDYNTEEFDYNGIFMLGLQKNISSSVYTSFKGTYDTAFDFVRAVNDKKIAVRYVFIPLNLGAKLRQVNMDDYQEVKRVFELND